MATLRHIHIDPVGGVAGDMFAAALLHAAPELADGLGAVFGQVPLLDGVVARVEPASDHACTGARFVLTGADEGHAHRSHGVIRAALAASRLRPGVVERALQIFAILAEAEGAVHGVPPDDVTFHEVGALDSIADIVAAAYLIDALGAASWSCAPLPVGTGLVDTAHGLLPLPAPATALLLRGMPTHADGRPGERVTPTGAAILRALQPDFSGVRAPMTLTATGTGFGTRALQGISNVVRVVLFEGQPDGLRTTELAVAAFELDDVTAEDLATAVQRLRALDGVRDVVQAPVLGKGGRMATHVRVLSTPEAEDAVVRTCFAETPTLGVRLHRVRRVELQRWSRQIALEDGTTAEVKLARRPGGAVTAKTEDRSVRDREGFATREAARVAARAAALEAERDEGC